jgi:DNA-binding transcriptional MerR regulator
MYKATKSLRDAADECGVTTRTMRSWIAKGLVVAYKRNNGRIFIDERSLDGMFTRIQGARR